MVQLYDTYSAASFADLIAQTDMSKYGEIVPFETAQMKDAVIVPFEMAQIPNVLFATGWTNHQIILNRCKTDAERLFYMFERESEYWHYPLQRRRYGGGALCFESQHVTYDGGPI